MSYAYDMGLRGGRCNGCKLRQYRYELGDKFLLKAGTIYKLDAPPLEGQDTPLSHNDRPIQFMMWGMSYEHSDECYSWRPPKKKKEA